MQGTLLWNCLRFSRDTKAGEAKYMCHSSNCNYQNSAIPDREADRDFCSVWPLDGAGLGSETENWAGLESTEDTSLSQKLFYIIQEDFS